MTNQLALNNDASQWERALQMPHYNAKHMPSLSVYQVLHLIQMARSGRFQMFDYGNSSANWAAYGGPKPPDLAANYGSLVGLPVDLIAGLRDGIVPPENIRIHLQLMNEAGVEVSYKEFDFGHLDFTFAVKEDLNMYLMKLLLKKK
ncbi:hypothetical protein CEUSTIGMA_g2058.t1 [Chlamydomonas eustigma]|uniref:AB hydrolase-1 domain-containing protein n=1 Tax=Chlamydomonas eustigma TaxID=1157962 RepID=A0A250WVQ2_9CHLO|nr:hypothetical protein CEUSTIGMA_g2058.t1 [Chlamydomonas eustigma]|eukprot:GAX74610.1 hypothetical protein CEUSTIGMA_g2058.t1 [Chlamydomonas eustigma]